jgi:hypothetical protein
MRTRYVSLGDAVADLVKVVKYSEEDPGRQLGNREEGGILDRETGTIYPRHEIEAAWALGIRTAEHLDKVRAMIITANTTEHDNA